MVLAIRSNQAGNADVGASDNLVAGWAMISLTTIRQPIGEIGALAARQIAARIEGKAGVAFQNSVLPTSFIRRNTTAPPRST